MKRKLDYDLGTNITALPCCPHSIKQEVDTPIATVESNSSVDQGSGYRLRRFESI
jgi:hypothetical protein